MNGFMALTSTYVSRNLIFVYEQSLNSGINYRNYTVSSHEMHVLVEA